FEPRLAQEIAQAGRKRRVKRDQIVMNPGEKAIEMPFVLSGLLRVVRHDSKGKEIFLYYLEGGDTCAMSLTCCMEGKPSEFSVSAEEDSALWMIPMGYLDGWVQRYRSFRQFVFSSYQARFDELLETIDDVAFLKMDERLYKYLLDKKQATGSYVINRTHEQIAKELNTSRVVVSRLLKQLEKQEKIEQYRNRIEIL
ncbi:MAG: Crp/Fnr family transcriptional regulator, partial [Bacteroidota bacterium]